MSSLVLSIIGASTTGVGKILFIGLVGAVACKYPKHSPLLPSSFLPVISRLSFNILILPLIYTGIASSVHLDELESLYPIILISLGIMVLSYIVTVCMGHLPCFAMQRETYFIPLCIASTFPNIVAFPIIIFPILCEYEVVQDLVKEDVMDDNGGGVEEVDLDEKILLEVCLKQTNAIVFTYFFGFSLVLWSFGHRTLVNLRKTEIIDLHDTTIMSTSRQHSGGLLVRGSIAVRHSASKIRDVSKEVFTSSGFVALMLGFITVCIGPLQRALFEVGGSLRVVGSALESLASAATTFATIIVAASLIKKEENTETDDDRKLEHEDKQANDRTEELKTCTDEDDRIVSQEKNSDDKEELLMASSSKLPCIDSNSMSIIKEDANRENQDNFEDERGQEDNDENNSHGHEKEDDRKVAFDGCLNCLRSIPRKTMKIYIWQIMARLFVTPGIVFFLLIRLDCSGLIDSIPNIAKLVLLLNSSAPGALVVVVILKANGLAEEADAVSNTFLPTYILSIFTYAMWCIFGLIAFRQDSDIC